MPGTPSQKYLETTALLSEGPDPRYRYILARRWGESARRVNFVMLNPSTADGLDDDPTIRRCVGFARAWGYDGLVVTNLFALRSTDPKYLRRAADPIGPLNDSLLEHQAKSADLVVCAWGAHGTLHARDRIVLRHLSGWGITPHHLGLTDKGCPKHPLYLPGASRPVSF